MEQTAMRGTTIVACRKNGKTAVGADSQATLGNMVFKDSVIKVRKIYNEKVLVGFAGKISEAYALFRLLEEYLNKYSGNLQRCVVEIAHEWQNVDAVHKELEASLIIADKDALYVIMGDGCVSQPSDCFVSIGSGSNFALGAVRALYENTDFSAKEMVEKSLLIASKYCIYTNDHLTIEEVQ